MSFLWCAFLQCLAISFQAARAQDQPQNGQNGDWWWAMHVLNAAYTGPANKDLGNEECVVGFVSYFCFDQKPEFSDYNSEEHVDDTVLEWIHVTVNDWGQYLSCCPPYSKTNPGDFYACNSWTNEDNDNCHTLNLPWNAGKIKAVGAQQPAGSKPVGGNPQWMYSFPAQGEGNQWTQGVARRIKTSDLAWYWVDQAGGCDDCDGDDIEDPCYGACINSALSTVDLLGLTNDALGDLDNFPNYGVVAKDAQGIMYWGDGKPGYAAKCLELSGGNSAWGSAIDLWDCNGLVNQEWTWNGDDLQIKLAGHNEPGMCIDLPGGQVYNGNPLWIWECNGTPEQQWTWDRDTASIRSKLNDDYCIDLPRGDVSNGNRLWLWQCYGGASQKWFLYKGFGDKVDSGAHMPASYRARTATNKSARSTSWMHNMKKLLGTGLGSNVTMPADWVPWYEKKHVKDWYAAQLPGPGHPRIMVPEGWNGYNSTGTPMPKVTVLV